MEFDSRIYDLSLIIEGEREKGLKKNESKEDVRAWRTLKVH